MKYPGGELEIFQKAVNWKAYWISQILPHIKGRVLEVGAGIGTNTIALTKTAKFESWTALEPDPALAQRIEKSNVALSVGTLDTLLAQDSEIKFDTILYIDVLEHIKNDSLELEKAAQCLNPKGSLLILAPAHNCLFTKFDAAIGHFRRYNKQTLREVIPPLQLQENSIHYLDSVGLSLSIINRLLVNKSAPNIMIILFWDRCLIPLSRLLDACLRHRVGKSVLGIWTKL